MLCKADTEAQKKEYWDRVKARNGSPYAYWKTTEPESVAILEKYGIPIGRATSDWWDADHIVPVIEGGGECGLDNLRTLCIPCHKKETAELRKRMAQQRKASRALPLMDSVPFNLTDEEMRKEWER